MVKSILTSRCLGGIIALVISGAGCQTKGPLITLPGCNTFSWIRHIENPQWQLGDFVAHQADGQIYCDYLRDYIRERLRRVELSSPPSAPAMNVESAPLMVISGRTAVKQKSGNGSGGKNEVEIETTLVVTETKKRTEIQKIYSITTLKNPDLTAIRNILRQRADLFLLRLDLAEISEMVRMRPGRSSYDRKGRKFAEVGDYERALTMFQKAFDAKPNDDAALYNAGVVCEVKCDYERALRYYRRAWTLSGRKEYRLSLDRINSKINNGSL